MILPLKKFKPYLPVALIVFTALVLRLYRISDYMTFLGDEGRDALVWLRMARLEKFTLIGPQTSIGNMYLGPMFYYLMLPFYLLFGTVGPSIGTALFAGGTTFLLWYCGRSWFSEKVGLIASLLYAVSPTAIVLSHSAWNPNIMPFFALLTVWGIWQFWQKDKFYWFPIIGLTFSIVIQSHYLGLLLAPLIGLFVVIKFITIIKFNRSQLKKYLFSLILSSFFFILLTIAPLVWFDLRHNGINFQAIKLFFTDRQTTVNLKVYKAIPNLWKLWTESVTSLLGAKNVIVGLVLSVIVLIGQIKPIGQIVVKKNIKNYYGYLLVCLWLLIGLVGLGLYKQHIYDHYFGFIFPAYFLVIAITLNQIDRFKYGKYLVGVLVFALVVINLVSNPLRYEPNRQMVRTKEVTEKIIEVSNNQPFNLGMIAKQNYDAGYRYFLEKANRPTIAIDTQRTSETITDQLFVVCEVEECKPVGHPQAEIANFGWVKIETEWSFPWGTRLFKLVHNQ